MGLAAGTEGDGLLAMALAGLERTTWQHVMAMVSEVDAKGALYPRLLEGPDGDTKGGCEEEEELSDSINGRVEKRDHGATRMARHPFADRGI